MQKYIHFNAAPAGAGTSNETDTAPSGSNSAMLATTKQHNILKLGKKKVLVRCLNKNIKKNRESLK
jgi:hypothetical protein